MPTITNWWGVCFIGLCIFVLPTMYGIAYLIDKWEGSLEDESTKEKV